MAIECLTPAGISPHSGYQNYGCRCPRCRGAKAAYSKAYRSKPENQERRRLRQRERYQRHRKILNAIKEAVGCVDCGVRDWRVIDFDHVDPSLKTQGVASMMRHSGSFGWIMNEVEKCLPRCANCHRIKTIEGDL